MCAGGGGGGGGGRVAGSEGGGSGGDWWLCVRASTPMLTPLLRSLFVRLERAASACLCECWYACGDGGVSAGLDESCSVSAKEL